MLDVEVVALAALLRGAGRLMGDERKPGRTSGGPGYPEAAWEAALDLDSRLPEALVLRAADRGAGGEIGPTGSGSSLNSVFNSVRLDGRAPPRPRTYLPVEYGGGGVRAYLPKETGGNGDRNQLEDAFARKLGELAMPDVGSLMNLLEHYGSYVNSGTSRGDVSIFDHSRAAAALAVCIAGHLNSPGETLENVEAPDAQRYYFVRGDLSGVQKFIYTITSRGALRMLRARSFFLELVAEHAVTRLLQHSGVPRTNVIFVGGGGFQLLLPNTEESKQAVRAVGEEINAALAAGFGHDLFLAVAGTPCRASGLRGEGLKDTLRNLALRLSEEKARKFRAELPQILEDRPEPGYESCGVCARDDSSVVARDPKGYGLSSEAEDAEKPIFLCETCGMLGMASLKLGRNKYLTQGGGDFRIGTDGYGLSESAGGAHYALDGVGDDACLNGTVPLPAARYALREGNQTLDFDGLSKKAAGVSRLAVLRMDVDNLGEVFRAGLPEEMRSFDRYAALSRAFTTFFKMVLPRICEGVYDSGLRLFSEEGSERAVSVVYSGGDDLFIVGAWSDVLELAVDVRRAFREFVCDNASVTLSGGISIHKSGEPLYLMAEQAGAAEGIAKKNKQNGREKDSMVLFYGGEDAGRPEHGVPQALFWDEVEGVVRLLEMVLAFRGTDGKLPFPRGFTRLLLDVVEVYEREGHLSLPRLAYALARMEEGDKRLRDDARWRTLKEELLKIETVKKLLRPVATWQDLAEREKGDRDG